MNCLHIELGECVLWYLLLWQYYGKSIRLAVKMFYAAFNNLFHCSAADCVLYVAIRFAGLI